MVLVQRLSQVIMLAFNRVKHGGIPAAPRIPAGIFPGMLQGGTNRGNEGPDAPC